MWAWMFVCLSVLALWKIGNLSKMYTLPLTELIELDKKKENATTLKGIAVFQIRFSVFGAGITSHLMFPNINFTEILN